MRGADGTKEALHFNSGTFSKPEKLDHDTQEEMEGSDLGRRADAGVLLRIPHMLHAERLYIVVRNLKSTNPPSRESVCVCGGGTQTLQSVSDAAADSNTRDLLHSHTHIHTIHALLYIEYPLRVFQSSFFTQPGLYVSVGVCVTAVIFISDTDHLVDRSSGRLRWGLRPPRASSITKFSIETQQAPVQPNGCTLSFKMLVWAGVHWDSNQSPQAPLRSLQMV